MRKEATWRIPVGILGMLAALMAYALVIARYVPDIIAGWHVALQTLVYIVLGVFWIAPLRRFLIWMETGSWSPPAE